MRYVRLVPLIPPAYLAEPELVLVEHLARVLRLPLFARFSQRLHLHVPMLALLLTSLYIGQNTQNTPTPTVLQPRFCKIKYNLRACNIN